MCGCTSLMCIWTSRKILGFTFSWSSLEIAWKLFGYLPMSLTFKAIDFFVERCSASYTAPKAPEPICLYNWKWFRRSLQIMFWFFSSIIYLGHFRRKRLSKFCLCFLGFVAAVSSTTFSCIGKALSSPPEVAMWLVTSTITAFSFLIALGCVFSSASSHGLWAPSKRYFIPDEVSWNQPDVQILTAWWTRNTQEADRK